MVTTFLKAKNRVKSNLAAAMTDVATSLTVTLGEHGLFPDTYPFDVTIDNEICRCTNRVVNVLTVTRAQQDTTAAAHSIGAKVSLNITAKAINDLNAAVNTIEQAIEEGFDNLIIKGTADYPLDMEGATVNSGGADIRLTNEAKIDNTVAGTLKLMTTASGYISISEGQTIIKGDYLDLDLDVALRFIGAGKNVDGALVFRDNITIGRSNAEVNAYLYSTLSIKSATTTDPKLRFETTNTAHEVVMFLDESAGHTHLDIEGLTSLQNMVIHITAQDGEDAEIMLASGDTNYSKITHASGDNFVLRNMVEDKNLVLTINDGGVSKSITFTGTSANLVLDYAAARHIEITGAATSAQLYIGGTAILASGEQAIYINAPSETVATNGVWITLGSTVTSGDLSGIRSRVTGNATSAGANVRGAYLEAKVGAGKYAAQLEGALIHADYSAGSATISGDVRGLTVHISQGSGLNAANLYGILLSIQTRGNETITTDDVGLLIRNEAVGGNGRTMDAALKITDLNMGGINGFSIGIDFTGITCTVAEIDLDFGKIIFDQDGDTDIHCDTDDELDFKLSGSNFLIMLAGAIRPGTTNQVDLGTSAKQFKDIYVDGVGYIDTMAAHTSAGITFNTGDALIRDATNTYIAMKGGTNAAGFGAVISLGGKDYGGEPRIRFYTPNAAKTSDIQRLDFSFGATAVATWANITHTGIVLSGALTLNGQDVDAGAGDLDVLTTGSVSGVIVKASHADYGGSFSVQHLHTTPDVGRYVGAFQFHGYDGDTPSLVRYGLMTCEYTNVTHTSEAANFKWYLQTGGTVDVLAMTLVGGALTLVAGLTIGGTLDVSDQILNNVSRVLSGAISKDLRLQATTVSGAGSTILVQGSDNNSGAIYLYTPDAAKTGDVLRMIIAGGTAAGSGAIHIYDPIVLNGQAFDAGSGYEQVNTTGQNTAYWVVTNDTAIGAHLLSEHVSASPAANDAVLRLEAKGRDADSPQNAVVYGYMDILIEDSTADHADGKFAMYLLRDQTATLAMTVTSLGAVGGDAAYAEFDKFDDVKLMVRSAIPQLCEIGVMSRKPHGEDGYMLNFQNAIYLGWGATKQNRVRINDLAVFTYQNRELLDNMAVSIADLEQTVEARLESVDEKIERLEGELAKLKASLN